MTKRDIRVRLPASLADFWKMQAENPGVRLYSGGTDLLVKRREGVVPADADLICLERMPELQRIEDEGREVFIGAGCTHARLLNHPLVKTCFPVLIQGLWVLGSPPIRHMASIGGNICTASPAGDSLPPLYVLAAELELRTENGRRRMPINDFISGPGKIDLNPGEILHGIRIRKQPEYNLHYYEKVGQRNALSISIAGLAVMAKISPERVIEDIRLAWGSVGPAVIRSRRIERALTGQPLTQKTLEAVFPLVDAAASPIDDIRAHAAYRLTVAQNLLLRLIFQGDRR